MRSQFHFLMLEFNISAVIQYNGHLQIMLSNTNQSKFYLV